MSKGDIDVFLQVLPDFIASKLHGKEETLVEVVMDLGRPPEVRFTDGKSEILSKTPIRTEDINHTITQIGDFGDDNRAGINRTLHRISAIRNRRADVVGLTCRVGRTVAGMAPLIRDLVSDGRNVLLLGRPGVGKTTMLREVARTLADDVGKRVVVVDTSNEIGGDGDTPHPAIGRSRRMHVRHTELQHRVMIEAVENHMPEVIVIDEMSTEQEALAARTIAERGVQLVATAHGNKLVNVLFNPTLSDLVGGVNTVTLGDEEARLRRTQKTIQERKHEPTFGTVVEIRERNHIALHHAVGDAVDRILRDWSITCEVRKLRPDGEIESQLEEIESRDSHPTTTFETRSQEPKSNRIQPPAETALKLHTFGISKPKLLEIAAGMNVNIDFTTEPSSASVLLTTKSHYQRRPANVRMAERSGVPVYVIRKASVDKISHFFSTLTSTDRNGRTAAIDQALASVHDAALELNSGAEVVKLEAQNAHIRRLQHKTANEFGLHSFSQGTEPTRHVVIRSR